MAHVSHKPILDKTVVLTFDDGCKSQATFVAPILKHYGFGATFYITEGLGFLKNKEAYMTWDEVRDLLNIKFLKNIVICCILIKHFLSWHSKLKFAKEDLEEDIFIILNYHV